MAKKNGKKKMKIGWKIAIIVSAILLCGVVCICWVVTNKASTAEAEFQQLVEFANRQQVEIAIITQTMELERVKTLFAESQQKRQAEVTAAKQDLQNKLNPEQE